MTVWISIVNFFWLPHSVRKSRWFTEDEAILSDLRLYQDTSSEKFSWADAGRELKDWKVWSFGFMALMYGVGSNSSSNFLPVRSLMSFGSRGLIGYVDNGEEIDTRYSKS